MPSTVLQRLTKILEPAAAKSEPPVQRRVKDALSGVIGERVEVQPWIDGRLAAIVPAEFFVPNGLRVVESAVPGHPAALVGSEKAVAGAERRLAKLCGEQWGARLVDFDPQTNSVIMAVFTNA